MICIATDGLWQLTAIKNIYLHILMKYVWMCECTLPHLQFKICMYFNCESKNKKGKLLWEYVKLDSKTYFTIASYSISIIKLPVIYIIKTFLLKIIILNESLQISTPINWIFHYKCTSLNWTILMCIQFTFSPF